MDGSATDASASFRAAPRENGGSTRCSQAPLVMGQSDGLRAACREVPLSVRLATRTASANGATANGRDVDPVEVGGDAVLNSSHGKTSNCTLHASGIHGQMPQSVAFRGTAGVVFRPVRAKTPRTAVRLSPLVNWCTLALVGVRRKTPCRFARLVTFVHRLSDRADEHDVDIVAAGLSFYALLGLFPALLALVSIYGLVADPASVKSVLTTLARTLPPQARAVVVQGVGDFVERSSSDLTLRLVFGIIAVLWSSSSGMSVLVRAINVAYEVKEKRSFFADARWRCFSRWAA